MSKQDGGSAFPQLSVEACERDGHGDLIEPFTSAMGGMSLRDWFAGQALACLLAERYPIIGKDEKDAQQKTAKVCYDLADALIVQRTIKGDAT